MVDFEGSESGPKSPASEPFGDGPSIGTRPYRPDSNIVSMAKQFSRAASKRENLRITARPQDDSLKNSCPQLGEPAVLQFGRSGSMH